MVYPFNELQLRQQYRLLAHEGHWTQGHCHDTSTGKIVSRELLHGEEAVIKWAKEQNGKGNVFIGGNPRDKDGLVRVCRILSLDLDPDRPKGSASTDEQLALTVEAARGLRARFGHGVVGISGNGALLIFPIPDTPVEKAEELGRALAAEARKHLPMGVKVDATHDAARLVKAMGCISTKGDKALWRAARFIDSPVRHECPSTFLAQLDTARQALPARITVGVDKGGELDRSKADFAMALRFKLQGFSPEDTYKALCSYATRPGREDDYKNIVEKVYAPRIGTVQSQSVQLWTPQSGLADYHNRAAPRTPELPMGYPKLDHATFGLLRGHLHTVGARTNCGKTTFAITVAHHLCKLGRKVLFMSTETQYQEVWDRYFAVGTGVSAFAIQHNNTNGSTAKVKQFIEEFHASHQFTVYDGSRPSIVTVQKAIEQAAPDVLIFDYFQHVEGRDTRALEEFVMMLKELAKEKQFAVLMCAQLHDNYNRITGKQFAPTMQDLKSCKVLNDESRVVMLLDWDRDAAVGEGPTAVKVILAKNKGSKTDSVLRLDRAIPRFTEEDIQC